MTSASDDRHVLPGRFSDLHHRRGTFGSAAADYTDGRPGYPDELYEVLRATTGVGPGSSVLEVGAGTGQATGPLLGLGADVTAIELDARMASRLLDRNGAAGRLEVVVGAFEDAREVPAIADRLGGGCFDLIASATAFHWVPADIGFDVAADLLRPGGWLALWWTTYRDPAIRSDIEASLDDLLGLRAPEVLLASVGSVRDGDRATAPYALDRAARIGEIDASRRFGAVVHHDIHWRQRHDAASLAALFASFSPFMALEPASQQELRESIEALVRVEFGGHVERAYVTSLYLAPRSDRPAG